MIGSLSGEVLEYSSGRVLIGVGDKSNTGQVGYIVSVPQGYPYCEYVIGKKISLLIYTCVREDAFDLFGFDSKVEKELFLALMSVSGIGPKSALGILTAASDIKDLVQAIIKGDQLYLTRIPGIGKKTAERVVLELRDKLKKKLDCGDFQLIKSNQSSVFQDASAALVGLGYREQEVESVLSSILGSGILLSPDASKVDEIVRVALRQLSKSFSR